LPAVAAFLGAICGLQLLHPPAALAQWPSITVQSENDAYPRWGDDDYTNGLRVSADFARALGWSRLGGGHRSCSDEPDSTQPCLRTTLIFGQNFYTPRDITISTVQPAERPYAAWLYGGFTARVAREGRLTSVELQMGTTGKAALGEPVQKWWHRLCGCAPQPRGWAHQVKPVPGVVGVIASWDDKFAFARRTHGSAPFTIADAIPYYRLSAGNVHTNAAAGVTLRIGYNIQRNWTEKIVPTALVASAAPAGAPRARHFFANAYAVLEGRAVAWNALLQHDTYTPRPLAPIARGVADREVGLALGYRRLSGGFRWVWRSPEFDGGRVSRFAGPFVTWGARTE
jgi:lipid A 3-O-deacylase